MYSPPGGETAMTGLRPRSSRQSQCMSRALGFDDMMLRSCCGKAAARRGRGRSRWKERRSPARASAHRIDCSLQVLVCRALLFLSRSHGTIPLPFTVFPHARVAIGPRTQALTLTPPYTPSTFKLKDDARRCHGNGIALRTSPDSHHEEAKQGAQQPSPVRAGNHTPQAFPFDV